MVIIRGETTLPPSSTLCAHVLKTLGKRLEPSCYARELCGLTRRRGEGHECLGRNQMSYEQGDLSDLPP